MDKRDIVQILEEIALLLDIKGENPFKVKAYVNAARSIELEYACIENRLLTLAGFGKKTQENILKSITDMNKYKGQHLFGDVNTMNAAEIERFLKGAVYEKH
jgi:DNA polymerase (family 10)